MLGVGTMSQKRTSTRYVEVDIRESKDKKRSQQYGRDLMIIVIAARLRTRKVDL